MSNLYIDIITHNEISFLSNWGQKSSLTESRTRIFWVIFIVKMLIKYSTTKLWDFKMVDPERFELSTDGLLDHRSTDWAKGPFSFGWKMWSCNLWLCQKPWSLKIIALCFNIIDLIYPSQYYHSLIILTNN